MFPAITITNAVTDIHDVVKWISWVHHVVGIPGEKDNIQLKHVYLYKQVSV